MASLTSPVLFSAAHVQALKLIQVSHGPVQEGLPVVPFPQTQQSVRFLSAQEQRWFLSWVDHLLRDNSTISHQSSLASVSLSLSIEPESRIYGIFICPVTNRLWMCEHSFHDNTAAHQLIRSKGANLLLTPQTAQSRRHRVFSTCVRRGAIPVETPVLPVVVSPDSRCAFCEQVLAVWRKTPAPLASSPRREFHSPSSVPKGPSASPAAMLSSPRPSSPDAPLLSPRLVRPTTTVPWEQMTASANPFSLPTPESRELDSFVVASDLGLLFADADRCKSSPNKKAWSQHIWHRFESITTTANNPARVAIGSLPVSPHKTHPALTSSSTGSRFHLHSVEQMMRRLLQKNKWKNKWRFLYNEAIRLAPTAATDKTKQARLEQIYAEMTALRDQFNLRTSPSGDEGGDSPRWGKWSEADILPDGHIEITPDMVTNAKRLAEYYGSNFPKRNPFDQDTCRVLCWLAMGVGGRDQGGGGRVGFQRLAQFAGWGPIRNFGTVLTRVCKVLEKTMPVPISERDNRFQGAVAELPHLLTLFPAEGRPVVREFVWTVLQGLRLDRPNYFHDGTQLETTNLRAGVIDFEKNVRKATREDGQLAADCQEWKSRLAQMAESETFDENALADLVQHIAQRLDETIAIRQTAFHREERARTAYFRLALAIAVKWLGDLAQEEYPQLAERAHALLRTSKTPGAFFGKISIHPEVRGIFCRYPLLRNHMYALARDKWKHPHPEKLFSKENIPAADVSTLCPTHLVLPGQRRPFTKKKTKPKKKPKLTSTTLVQERIRPEEDFLTNPT